MGITEQQPQQINTHNNGLDYLITMRDTVEVVTTTTIVPYENAVKKGNALITEMINHYHGIV